MPADAPEDEKGRPVVSECISIVLVSWKLPGRGLLKLIGLLVVVAGISASADSLAFTNLADRSPIDVESNRLVHQVDVLDGEDRFQLRSGVDYFTGSGGLLTMTFGNSESNCTGFLVGKQWILTSAHCVYDLETAQPAREIVFDPVKNQRHDFTFPREYASEFYILKDALELIRTGRALNGRAPTPRFMEKDLAVIRIPTLAGRKPVPVNPLRMATARDPGKRVYMQSAGYPSDKEEGTYWFVNCNGLLNETYDLYETKCDAVPGQSGSAVVQIWSPEELEGSKYPVPNEPVMIGVISAVSPEITLVTALTQPLIDEIHGLIGKTDAAHPSFERVPLKRGFENRLFVHNTCSRDVTIFAQAPERIDGEVVKKLRGWDIPAGKRAQLLRSTFSHGEIIKQPEDANRVTLSRQVGPFGKPEPLGPVKSVWLEEKRTRIAGYPYLLGEIWTDSRLVIACVD